jgi:hypothetical protein
MYTTLIDAAATFMGIFGLKQETGVLKYHPKHKPVPKGWIVVNDMQSTHHGEYSVLIKKV